MVYLPDNYQSTTFDELVEMAQQLDVPIPQTRNRKILYDRINAALTAQTDARRIAQLRREKEMISGSQGRRRAAATASASNKTTNESTPALERGYELRPLKPTKSLFKRSNYQMVMEDGQVKWLAVGGDYSC